MAYYNGIQIANSIDEPGTPVAGISPLYEVATPQYPIPQPYALAQLGYRRNEIVFACIQKRAQAVSEAPLALYKGDNDKPVKDHPILDLIKHPNEAMGEMEFWMAVQIYLDIAGFSVWEKEYNRLGEVMRLWPMRPDWCSFRRGDTRPLEYVRYQPWGGIPFVDVPIERCIVFMEFDPIWPMLKGFGRTAAVMRALGVDNAASDFLKLFFDHGAQTNGIIKTKQSLQAAEAKRIKDLWRDQHGGAANWQDITVLGSDIDYIATQMNFKDMGLENIDGRTESRICQCFDMQPVLIGSRIGLNRAIDNNYEMALKQFIEGPISARWRWLESEMTQQLIPDFEGPDSDYRAGFDTRKVRALQENMDKRVARAVEMAKLNLWWRDRALQEVGDDPIDGGAKVFVGITAKAVEPPAVSAMVFDPSLDAETLKAEAEQAKEAAANQPPPVQLLPGQPGGTPTTGAPTPQPPQQPPASDQFNQMVKSFSDARQKALAAVKATGNPLEGWTWDWSLGVALKNDLSNAKTAQKVRDLFEKHWPTKPSEPSAADVLAELKRHNDIAERLLAGR